VLQRCQADLDSKFDDRKKERVDTEDHSTFDEREETHEEIIRSTSR